MIHWYSNFQIPNSGTQTERVFVKVKSYEIDSKGIVLNLVYSADSFGSVILKEEIKYIELLSDSINENSVYKHLLTLPEYSMYSFV